MKRVSLLMGGYSAEREVSLASGANCAAALKEAGYPVEIVDVKGDIRGIVRAVHLGRATLRNIRQNLLLAFGYNALAIPVAAGVLYPSTGIVLSPMIAAAAMSLSSVSVIVNALRLRKSR